MLVFEAGSIVGIPSNGAPVVPQELLMLHRQGIHVQCKGSKPRPLRKKCDDDQCTNRTQYFCILCKKSYCNDDSTQTKGRCCFYAHICRVHLSNKSVFASKRFKQTMSSWNIKRLETIKEQERDRFEEVL